MLLSKKAAKAQRAIEKVSSLVSKEESSRINLGQLELQDDLVVVKTYVPAGESVVLVSQTKNKEVRRGINDFQDGQLTRVGDGGSMIVDAIRISHAGGVKTDDPASKSYSSESFPSDLENSIIRISQGERMLKEIKISQHVLKGDSTQKIGDDFVELDNPIVLIAGSTIKIELLRPEELDGAEAFLALEFDGMRTSPKRTK